jgi:hypothetical protein
MTVSGVGFFASKEELVGILQKEIVAGMGLSEIKRVVRDALETCSCWFGKVPLIGWGWKRSMKKKIFKVAHECVEIKNFSKEINCLSRRAQGVVDKIQRLGDLYNLREEMLYELGEGLEDVWEVVLDWTSRENGITFSDLIEGKKELSLANEILDDVLSDLSACEKLLLKTSHFKKFWKI